jgi:hypothetical protein
VEDNKVLDNKVLAHSNEALVDMARSMDRDRSSSLLKQERKLSLGLNVRNFSYTSPVIYDSKDSI